MAGEGLSKFGLTARQQRFADLFLLYENATKAYLEAYGTKSISSAAVNGSKSIRIAKIADYIAYRQKDTADKLAKKYDTSREKVLQEAHKISNYNVQDFYDENGVPIPIQDLPRDLAAAIQGFDANGYKLPNKSSGLDIISKMQGYYEKHQKQGAGVVVIKIPEIDKPKGAGE